MDRWARNIIGDITGLAPNSITTRYCIGGKYEKRGLLTSIHAFYFIDLIDQ
jgi:hypothetical protein